MPRKRKTTEEQVKELPNTCPDGTIAPHTGAMLAFSYGLRSEEKKTVRGQKRLERQALVAHLYLRERLSQAIIAKRLKISVRNVKHDLKAIREAYADIARNALEDHLHEELAQAELVRREAWDGWHRSKQDAVSIEQKVGKAVQSEGTKAVDAGDDPPVVVEEKRTAKGQAGDPRFLETVLKAGSRVIELANQFHTETGDTDRGAVPYEVQQVIIANRTEAAEAVTLPAFKHQFEGYEIEAPATDGDNGETSEGNGNGKH